MLVLHVKTDEILLVDEQRDSVLSTMAIQMTRATDVLLCDKVLEILKKFPKIILHKNTAYYDLDLFKDDSCILIGHKAICELEELLNEYVDEYLIVDDMVILAANKISIDLYRIEDYSLKDKLEIELRKHIIDCVLKDM